MDPIAVVVGAGMGAVGTAVSGFTVRTGVAGAEIREAKAGTWAGTGATVDGAGT